MRIVVLCLVTVAMAGCSWADSRSSADCDAQVRVADVLYTSYGTTNREATRHLLGDEAECHDFGRNAGGSLFPDNPAQVRTWTFEGHSPEKVLGVRYGTDAFGVFIAETVRPSERKRIYADLSGRQS